MLLPPLAFVVMLAVGCGGSTENDGEPALGRVTPALCSEASPTEARLAFSEGEIGALAAMDGHLLVGARSLRVGEEGAVWRVAFDGSPSRPISPRYIGGPVHVTGGSLLHAEPVDQTHASLVVTPADGSGPRRVLEGPKLVFGEFDVVRDRAFFFGREDADIALWSYDSSSQDAKVARVADATGGGLFTNGNELLQAVVEGEPAVVHVRRLDRHRGVFVELTSFPVFERTVVGADADALYLHDAPTRTMRSVDLVTGKETRTLGGDLDGTIGGAYLTDDAIYAFQTSDRRFVRIDKATGEQAVVAHFADSAFVTTFASDGCYVYAAIDGMRVIARVPRGAR